PATPATLLGQHTDIGPVGFAGSYANNGGTISVTGSGSDIWYTADQCHYAYQTLTGDGEIIARITSFSNTDGSNIDGWAKAGPMIRESLDPSSRHAMIQMTGGSGVQFQYRVSDGAYMASQGGSGSVPPRWLRLVRQGNQLQGYEAADGNTWTLVGQ